MQSVVAFSFTFLWTTVTPSLIRPSLKTTQQRRAAASFAGRSRKPRQNRGILSGYRGAGVAIGSVGSFGKIGFFFAAFASPEPI
jgi:hypothetical protein